MLKIKCFQAFLLGWELSYWPETNDSLKTKNMATMELLSYWQFYQLTIQCSQTNLLTNYKYILASVSV